MQALSKFSFVKPKPYSINVLPLFLNKGHENSEFKWTPLWRRDLVVGTLVLSHAESSLQGRKNLSIPFQQPIPHQVNVLKVSKAMNDSCDLRLSKFLNTGTHIWEWIYVYVNWKSSFVYYRSQIIFQGSYENISERSIEGKKLSLFRISSITT